MGGDDEPTLVEETTLDPLSIEDALSIIGEETRARIIRELGAAWDEETATPARLTFSELMTRVGVQDSGRFNYHLDKLVGTFIEKFDTGYGLRQPGHLLYQAIVAGTLTDRRTIEPFPVGGCPSCDGTITAAYRSDQVVVVQCHDCGKEIDGMPFPSRGVTDRTEKELLDAAYQKMHHDIGLLRRGTCHGCGAMVDRNLTTTLDGPWVEVFEFDVYAVLVCSVCNEGVISHPVTVALSTPVVVGFFDTHDRDVARTYPWESVVQTAKAGMTVQNEDPTAVSIPFELGQECLLVRLDSDLQPVASELSAR